MTTTPRPAQTTGQPNGGAQLNQHLTEKNAGADHQLAAPADQAAPASASSLLTIDDLRTSKLARLVDEHGGQEPFAARIGCNPSQLSQWLNRSLNSITRKPRVISTASCRKIELALGLPMGWFDWREMPTEIEGVNVDLLMRDLEESGDALDPALLGRYCSDACLVIRRLLEGNAGIPASDGAHDQHQLASEREDRDAAARAGALRAMGASAAAVPAQAGTSNSTAVIEVLQRIADRLRRGGAFLPLPRSTEAPTIESTLVRGLSLGLLLVETEIEATRMEAGQSAQRQGVAS